MKKLFTTLATAFCLALPALAQEEDVTYYIQNPGFDEDISLNVDGTASKSYVSSTSTSASIFNVTEDGSIYNRNNEGHQSWNGFNVKIKGWESTNTSQTPEWFYFLSIPYALNEGVLEVGRDGEKVYPPSKPEELDTEDNTGVLYLRAGWGNRCTYKQEVKLPCAVYRLDYYVRNTNAAKSSSVSGIENLCNVTCRRDVFVDEEGFQSEEWVKHSIEFTPVDAFTIEFGYKSGDNNNSNQNPHIWIDGIKLYRIGEADPADLLREEMNELYNQLSYNFQDDLLGVNGDPFYGLMDEAAEYADDLYSDDNDTEAIQQSIAELTEAIAKVKAGYEAALRCETVYAQIQNLLSRAVTYPGLEALTLVAEDAYGKLYGQDGARSEEFVELEASLKAAILAYYESQEATLDTPADYTYLVQHPWFCNDDRVPASNSAADVAYAALSDSDKNAEGWVNGSTASGATVGAWFNVGRTCYQLWATNFTGYLDVHQTLTDIPNGIYSLQADLVTNASALATQHIYASSAIGTTEGYMTEAAMLWEWTNGAYAGSYPDDGTEPWETVVTDGTVIVTDGTLTIGARSTHDTGDEPDYSNGGRAGSFWMTNFVLRYHGPASEADVQAALQQRLEEANSLAASMHFAADRAAVEDSIRTYQSGSSLEVAPLNGGIALAETSEAKYEEIMAEGKTIPTVAATLAEEGEAAYGVAHDIVAFASEKTQQWLSSAEATYRDADARIALMKGYTLTYTEAFLAADEAADQLSTSVGRQVIQETMARQKEFLLAADTLASEATVNQLVEELNAVVRVAGIQELYEQNAGGTDFTAFIQNPDAAAESGWTLVRGTGDKNSTAGQHYTGDSSRRYFDSYNGTAGTLDFYGEQRIEGLPNGTYTVRAAVRTSGEGAFLLAANGGAEKTDTTFVEIPLQTYTYFDDVEGEELTVNATDHYGAIWQVAFDKMMEGTADDDEMAIATANATQGYGWEWLSVEGVEVNNHVLVIGFTTDGNRTGKAFTGTWFSATDFTLTLTAEGDNMGYNGPLNAIETLRADAASGVADGVYDLSGRRVADTRKAGFYVVVRGGKAVKAVIR